MWREIIAPFGFQCTFPLPVQQNQLLETEELLQVKLPDDLQSLYLETDGIILPTEEVLIWPIEKLQFYNQQMFREVSNPELFMSFDNMLFFAGDDDCNIAYGYSIKQSGIILSTFIYRWDVETDSRTWVAINLKSFIELVFLGIHRL
jgi:hypothetical protein